MSIQYLLFLLRCFLWNFVIGFRCHGDSTLLEEKRGNNKKVMKMTHNNKAKVRMKISDMQMAHPCIGGHFV